MSKNKKAKSQKSPHPLVHNRLVTRRQRGTDQPGAQDAALEPQASDAQPEGLVEQPAAEPKSDEILDQPYCEVLDEPVDRMAPVTPEVAPAEPQVEGQQKQLPEAEQPAPETTELETAVPASQAPTAPEASAPEAQAEGTAQPETPPAKPKKAKKESGPKKLSCLDAAAQVLKAAGKAMGCGEMIEEMSKQGLWSSPNGATPAATLYSAILRELKKGDAARFVKADRGKFVAKG